MRVVRRYRGITLIELMITLVVLVVLISLAAPQMGQFVDQRRLVGAAEAVYSHMQFARTEAVKQSRNMHISFGGSGTDWCVGFTDKTTGCDCTEDDPDPAEAGCTISVGTDRVFARIQGGQFTNVSMQAAPTGTIAIDYVRGVVTPINAIPARLESARGRELRVSIGAMGRTQICSPAGAANVPGYPGC